MKPITCITLAGLISVSFSGLSQASELETIVKEHNDKKIAAVKAYMDKNPDAEDIVEAYDILITANEEIGNDEAVTGLLGKKYHAVKKTMSVRELIPTVIQPYFEALVSNGQKEKAQALVDDAKETFAEHEMAVQLSRYFNGLEGELKKPSIGDTMDITFTSVNGDEKIDVQAMKDKVVLVDFWATWCGPCIGELPHVKEAYEKYHDKGFEIVGISLDKDVGKLRSFLKEEGMTWPQYFDGKGWGNDIAKKFSITGIPATFLLKDGKIVASNLRGEALGEAVAKHLGE